MATGPRPLNRAEGSDPGHNHTRIFAQRCSRATTAYSAFVILSVCEMPPCRGYLSEISLTEEHLIRVLVVDDFKPWHHFVAAALESDPRYKVVGFASNGSGAIEQSQTLRPDVILVDINLPGWSGMVVAQKMREVAPEAQIIFFTEHISAEFVAAAFDLGARGFVAKRDGQELLPAVNTVMSGEKYLSERVRKFRSDPAAED